MLTVLTASPLYLACNMTSTRYLGKVIKRLKGLHSWTQCYMQCRETKGCKYWTVMYGEGCTLLSSYTGKRSEDAMTSGRRCSRAEEKDFFHGR